MTHSLRDLLNAATFKFSTSIAGLLSSLVLSLIFRSYSILIEQGFDRFCRTLEARLNSVTPQALAFRTLQVHRQQLVELQQMNTAQYFERLGTAIAPAIGDAVTEAVAPLTEKLNETAGRLQHESKKGTEDLLKQFGETVKGSVGRELQELAGVLSQTTDALKSMRDDLSSTGDKFAEKISEATNAFVHLVQDASAKLSQSNEGSREAIEQALRALALAAEDARKRIDESTSQAGRSAADVMNQGLQNVLAKVTSQMESFQTTISGLQETIARESAASVARSRASIEAAAQDAARSASEGADAIRVGLGDIVSTLRADVEKMSTALKLSEAAFASQAKAADATAERSGAAAEAFGRVAENVNNASLPLLQASERIARSTDSMSQAVRSAAESLANSQTAARALAETLQENHSKLEALWSGYSEKFDKVDASLAGAITTLASETTRYQERIKEFVNQIDTDCAKAITSLQGIVSGLDQNTEDLSETFGQFLSKLSERTG
jgi:chemotaxis protein histidine kinase CheA